MSSKPLPTSWKFYADLLVDLIEKHGSLTRKQFAELADDILENQGYNWDKSEKIPTSTGLKVNYKIPYYRVHSAITEIRKRGGVWRGKQIEKITQGKDVIYGFSEGIHKAIEDGKQMSLGENLEVQDLPEGLKTKKKSTGRRTTLGKKLPIHVSTSKYREIETELNAGEHVLLKGKPGIGKTYNAIYWGKKNGWAIHKAVLTRESAEWQLLGRSNLILTYSEIRSYAHDKDANCVKKCAYERVKCPTIQNSSIEIMNDTWIDGVFTQAARSAQKGIKTMLIVDEVNFGDQSVVAGTLNPMLEDQEDPNLTIKDTGEYLEWKRENWRVVATMNPGTMGTFPLNEAFRDRFFELECDLPKNWEIIVEAQTSRKPSSGMKKLFLQVKDSGTIQKTVALRSIIKWTRHEKMYGDIAKTKRLQGLILQQFEDNDKKIVKEIMKGAFI